MGTCFHIEKQERRPGSKKEKSFEPMKKMNTMKELQDVKIGKSEFVLHHKKTKFQQLYHVESDQIIGSGGYGTVQRCQHIATKELRAVKIMKKAKISESDQIRLRYEIEILQNLDHPNILRLYEVFEDKKFFYLVTELCEGGELFDEIISRGRFEEKDAAQILKQLLSAIAYCHSNNVCHRDLKPENVLIDNKDKNTIKLIDFGTSQVYDGEKMELVLGTAYYIAPEVLNGQYDEKCDIWSIGVILYILLSGEPPFPGDTDSQIIASVKRGKYNFQRPAWKSRSKQVKEFISSLMQLDPKMRPTALKALEHPWILQKTEEVIDRDLATEAFSNLKKFRTEQKLQQAAITFIVCQMSTKQEREMLYESFKAIDKNSDGKISKEELFEAYTNIYPHLSYDEIKKEVEKLFKQADTDGNGEIDFSEWQVATINKYSILEETKLRGAFKLFDKDNNGSISAQEIKQVLGVGKKFGNEHIWDEIIQEVDINGDGVISYEEFKTMMQKFLIQTEIESNKGSILSGQHKIEDNAI